MDTVYGTKKYFQSLSGVSDIYRTQTCRGITNDYTYQNTLGRRSQLGAYYHMNKQPSYTNDNSINSQYGYNTWGIWRDGRNIAPSTFSAKTHSHYPKNRSFSIILTTAAFIVLLAVISIAGLAFYFSSIKPTLEDPILGFEGSFRIAKGDLYSTGLKYNHTTTYKQKIDFYKRFVERSLSDNGLQPLRTDVWGFGDGPLIKVSFRIFLDVRKLPQNILSVEEYIKESLFIETSSAKSLYRSLRLDTESVEIKRILDEQVVRSAAILKEAQTVPTSQTQLEKRLMKKGNSPLQAKPALIGTPKPPQPRTTARPHTADEEPDVDVENAPVIQGSFEGSFEITKTDADIARKKAAIPTRAYQSSSSSSLPPKTVTPFPLRVKSKKPPSIEKMSTLIPQMQAKTTTSTTTTTTTTTSTTTLVPSTSRQTTTTTTPSPPPPSTTTTTTTTKAATTTPTTTTARPIASSTPTTSTTMMMMMMPTTPTISLPKLDASLFTTFPILDTQPWRPIHREVPELLPGPPPAFPTKTLPGAGGAAQAVQPHVVPPSSVNHIPQRRIDELELPFIGDNPQPPISAVAPAILDHMADFLNPPPLVHQSDLIKDDNDKSSQEEMLFYHNFGSPIFMPGTENIERLGGALVEPHPLPVPLLDDVIVPEFKPISPTLDTIDKLPFNIDDSDEKFEHLGGGVIAKKHENSTAHLPATVETTTAKSISSSSTSSTTTTISGSTTPLRVQVVNDVTTEIPFKPTDNTILADTIGEFFMELLKLPKEDNGTTTTTTTTKEPIESESEAEQELVESRIEPEEESIERSSSTTTTTTTTTTIKPNFLNLKELILQRKQPNATHPSPSPVTTSSSTKATTTTTVKPTIATTKRNRIRPSSDLPPTMLDDSNLFPSHSKWEFVNSSSTQNFGHNGNMRKVFNQTLQAWVSEDVDKSENFTLNDIKTRINNATNIQDISLIFDTLASRLGITPSVQTKFPPFSQTNKFKHPALVRNETKDKLITTTSSTTTMRTSSEVTKSEQFSSPGFIELPLQQREPFIRPMSSFMDDSSDEVIGAAIPVIGEAEVEVIDPLKYDEMLKRSQFASPPPLPPAPPATTTTEATNMQRLVTLLPVRSNSGIRTYNPPADEIEMTRSRSSSSSSSSSSTRPSARVNIRRKSNTNQSRRFGRPPAEAIVKGGLSVTVN